MRSTDEVKKGQRNLSIGQALFPKIKRQLLTLFLSSSDSRYYFREITRLVGASPGAVQRELANLTEAGILKGEKVGRQQYYWADRECMIYRELRDIVVKTFGVADLIESALSVHRDAIKLALIYGSIASGKDTSRSDIDLLVVGKLSFRELAVVLEPVESALRRPINPTVYSEKQFKSKYTSDDHFIGSVFGSKVIYLIGAADDTPGLAGK